MGGGWSWDSDLCLSDSEAHVLILLIIHKKSRNTVGKRSLGPSLSAGTQGLPWASLARPLSGAVLTTPGRGRPSYKVVRFYYEKGLLPDWLPRPHSLALASVSHLTPMAWPQEEQGLKKKKKKRGFAQSDCTPASPQPGFARKTTLEARSSESGVPTVT